MEDGLVRFLQHHQTGTPRCIKALKILQKRTSYEIYYISPYNEVGHAATCHYTPPRKGGSFKLHPKLFVKFPYLIEFAVSKIRATMILESLHNHSASYEIATLSWQQEMEHINSSINITCLVKDYATRHLAIILNFYSVVQYNVGYHFDRFHKGMASLENKAIFRVPSYSQNSNPGEDNCRGGGKYVGDFHYALLDWGSHNRERRQWAIANNIILPNQKISSSQPGPKRSVYCSGWETAYLGWLIKIKYFICFYKSNTSGKILIHIHCS